jgi:PAS domain S-box-containing protein
MENIASANIFQNTITGNRDALVTLIDSIPALVAYVDCNMKLQYCNKPFKTWFSLNTDTTNKSFPLLIGNEAFEQLQRHLGKILVGKRANFQISMKTPQGIQYLEATLSPDFDEKQVVKGFIFHSADVTEKNRTESTLKDYFENAAIGIHWVNSDGIILWANPAELRMLGYSEEEYVGRHISEFHASPFAINDILHRLKCRESLKNYDTDLVCKDGSIRHATINSTVLWEGETFLHTRCFTIDVTERRRAAVAVQESEARFRTMASLVPLIIWTTDSLGECIFLNTKWTEFTGMPAEEGFGTAWIEFVHRDDRENIRQSWTRTLTTKKVFEAKFRLCSASGDYPVCYAHSTPRYDAAGNFAGYIGIIQNISTEEQIKSSLEKIVLERTDDLRRRNTDLKKAETALQKKNHELEEINNQLEAFAHIASHDLQEPLRKIQTYSSRLFELESDKFSPKSRELYQRIQNSSERMRNLIQDLLTFSKSNFGDAKFEEVDLNLLLQEVLGDLEVKIGDRNATVENKGLPTLRVISFQFHQLLLNLISNALKFSKPSQPSNIQITSEVISAHEMRRTGSIAAEGTYQLISIADNGIGFDPHFADRIFEMFHRLHNRSNYEGTGIGLAICKKIVENHRGFIRAEGRPGQGATFKIYLPAGG